MKQIIAILAVLILTQASGNAGTLVNGNWTPAHCGAEPEPPVIDKTNIENFNRSIDAINAWQDRALEYHACMVKEANADNERITNTANQAQSRLQDEINRINAEADQVRNELTK
ncbi:hypothetical protein SAMN05421690_1003115 [Nitrosomonas sp. Nm51]|uniref:hypothetical protein n=1 Tax=Nitrosomonas sp. Nm51 TaxID=133720 RepID=UPI0008CE4522|nr:hypothetical protein [Nitrosomonas sp. Nm51]SEQ91383.1 hypothetical protein SAMN05421690_1003115 [Nitrosomonas sp. Nm51]